MIDDARLLAERVTPTLKLIETIIENLSQESELDEAEELLNVVADMYRKAKIPNNNRRYVAVASLVAHARMDWNSVYHHILVVEL